MSHMWATPHTRAHIQARNARTHTRRSKVVWPVNERCTTSGANPRVLLSAASCTSSPSDVVPLAPPCFRPSVAQQDLRLRLKRAGELQ